MHILTNSKPIAYGAGTLQPGEWLVQDDNAFQLAMMAERGTVGLKKWTPRGSNDFQHVPPGICDWESFKNILIVRSGAIGDLLLLTPALRALRTRFPQAQLWLCSFKKHWDIFAQGDMHFVEYPLRASEVNFFDLIIPLENVIELNEDKHATDAFADALGVTVADYRPVYKVTKEEDHAVWTNATPIAQPNSNSWHKRVALHIHSSSAIRDYPTQKWLEVIDTLLERDWQIILLGSKDRMRVNHRQIKDCSNLSFREAAAALSTCAVFCGVDSSFFNLCPALGVPAIGLFGPVDWRTRIKDTSIQTALHGSDCPTCNWTNARAGHAFPPNGPCAKERQCVNLSAIQPARIVSVIERTYAQNNK